MADTSKRLAGTAYVSVDGQSYMLQGSLSYRVSNKTRETLLGMDGVHGYSEKPAAGFISGTFRDSGGLSVASFGDMTNVTVTAELANGKLIVLRNGWTVEAQEVNSEEGTFDVRWESPQVEEA